MWTSKRKIFDKIVLATFTVLPCRFPSGILQTLESGPFRLDLLITGNRQDCNVQEGVPPYGAPRMRLLHPTALRWKFSKIMMILTWWMWTQSISRLTDGTHTSELASDSGPDCSGPKQKFYRQDLPARTRTYELNQGLAHQASTMVLMQ